MPEAQLYPGATWHPLGRQSESRMGAHDIVCVHTMVGYLATTEDMFERDGYGGTESTYGVGGPWGPDGARGLDGAVRQWQDRAFTADANLDGNWHVTSIETADNAPRLARDIARWSPAQAEALIQLLVWECSPASHRSCPRDWDCHKVGIPPVMIPDTKPGRRGLAVHRQGIEHSAGVGKVDGYLEPGGERWSEAVGKECPGDARVAQFRDEIVPAVRRRLLAGDAMPISDADLDKIARAVWRTDDMVANLNAPVGSKNPAWSAGTALAQADEKLDRAAAALAGLAADVNELQAAVDQLARAVKAAPLSNTVGVAGALSDADARKIIDGVAALLGRVRVSLDGGR